MHEGHWRGSHRQQPQWGLGAGVAAAHGLPIAAGCSPVPVLYQYDSNAQACSKTAGWRTSMASCCRCCATASSSPPVTPSNASSAVECMQQWNWPTTVNSAYLAVLRALCEAARGTPWLRCGRCRVWCFESIWHTYAQPLLLRSLLCLMLLLLLLRCRCRAVFISKQKAVQEIGRAHV